MYFSLLAVIVFSISPAKALPPQVTPGYGYQSCTAPCVLTCEKATDTKDKVPIPSDTCYETCSKGCVGEFYNPNYTGQNTGSKSTNCLLSEGGCYSWYFFCAIDIANLTNGLSGLISLFGGNSTLTTAIFGAAKSAADPCGYVKTQCLQNAPC